MESNIVVTSPIKEDIKSTVEVRYKAWLEAYPNEELGITTDDVIDRFKDKLTDEAAANIWLRMEENKNIKMLVAKEGEKVVGMAVTILKPDENQFQALYVLPEYQGRGIGTRLWNEALKGFNHKNKIIVPVATYNKKAIKFYERLGFKDNGKRWADEKFRMKSGAIIPEMEMEMKMDVSAH